MVVWRLRIFKLTRRGAVAALAPAAVVLYLFSYTYLGASRGVAIFNFLLNTALGNLVLSLVAAFYAYNIAKSIATPLCSRITELESPLLEDLHLLVLVPALSTTIYPVLRTVAGVQQGFLDLSSVLLTLAISFLILISYTDTKRGPVAALSYVSAIVVILVAFTRRREVSEFFTELARLVSLVEALIRELGVV